MAIYNIEIRLGNGGQITGAASAIPKPIAIHEKSTTLKNNLLWRYVWYPKELPILLVN